MKKVLLTGGTGFIGKNLVSYLTSHGIAVNILSRNARSSGNKLIKYFQWNPQLQEIDESSFEGVSDVVNLAGANIGDKRWSVTRKEQIVNSRMDSVRTLNKAIRENNIQLNSFIGTSAIGYYGSVTEDLIFNEESPKGSDFLASVCDQWEEEYRGLDSDLINNTSVLRLGVVLGREGGVYKKMRDLSRFYLGSPLGSGKQYLPWIHIEDLCGIFYFILQNGQSKTYNAVADEHVIVSDFTNQLCRSINKRVLLPNVPGVVLKIVLGEMSSMVLEGTRIENTRIKKAGYVFKYSSLPGALDELSKK
ncbi:TIGR01777 family oxidoreductase [Bacteroidia bacterium]|nr:TIGR01777 family oxidoreductase [Bacteroidia bacterium]MDB9882829.1 TIGR01777 family oxidoreductase [Bacteroidia bacterium]MDC1394947.1 TIGR01777 family oxidoreductase [Bacteroidia bacterium]